ncbi:MAG: type III pantothenate kinase [Ferrovum sp.]|nr:type III pantothenate kinase [Ferrovum sp.]NDU86762.1 type III pantothenate kinase [Ferrovum sp.]
MAQLYLDIGNSQLKWGVRHHKQWLHQGRLALPELGQLPKHWAALGPIQAIHGICVAADSDREQVEAACHTLSLKPVWHRSKAREGGVTNHYDTPDQLGADRWMALLAARQMAPHAALVVMAGTATTIDSLDDQGHFLGGMILPGLTLMGQSLTQGTAGLPNAHQGKFLPTPRCTVDAIYSGIVSATLGAILLARQRFSPENPTIPIILGGGHRTLLLPHLPLPVREVPELVLEGLALSQENPIP